MHTIRFEELKKATDDVGYWIDKLNRWKEARRKVLFHHSNSVFVVSLGDSDETPRTSICGLTRELLLPLVDEQVEKAQKALCESYISMPSGEKIIKILVKEVE